MKILCSFGLIVALVGCATIEANITPVIDGHIQEEEWSTAQIHEIPSGGTIRLLKDSDNLYIAVSGVETGFPTVFVGDSNTVDVLHASAAQASVTYLRSGATWRPATPSFDYTLRQNIDGSQAPEEIRQEFLKKHGWLSTSDRSHARDREFLVKLTPERRFLAVSILGIPSMKTHGWPAGRPDGSRDPSLLQGEVPSQLKFSPESWLLIKQ